MAFIFKPVEPLSAGVTGGALGMAAGGFSFAACAVFGGEVDLAAHCVLGPGAAFSISPVVAGAGLRELFG